MISNLALERSTKQKVKKEALKLNHNRDKMSLTDKYRIFYPTECAFFSAFSLK